MLRMNISRIKYVPSAKYAVNVRTKANWKTIRKKFILQPENEIMILLSDIKCY